MILQKPGDAQLRVHSSYGSNNPFLREACESFAAFAPKDAVLVVKQHPLDYGVERSPRLFASLVKKLNLEGRAYYLRKTSIDIVLDNTDGFVMINSTSMAVGVFGVPSVYTTLCVHLIKGLLACSFGKFPDNQGLGSERTSKRQLMISVLKTKSFLQTPPNLI